MPLRCSASLFSSGSRSSNCAITLLMYSPPLFV
jgi:hypothetical protein